MVIRRLGLKGYDVRDILDSEAVESYDLRSYYGAYIEGHPAMDYEPDMSSSGKIYDNWFTRSNRFWEQVLVIPIWQHCCK